MGTRTIGQSHFASRRRYTHTTCYLCRFSRVELFLLLTVDKMEKTPNSHMTTSGVVVEGGGGIIFDEVDVEVDVQDVDFLPGEEDNVGRTER
jgi:hypothetical protein